MLCGICGTLGVGDWKWECGREDDDGMEWLVVGEEGGLYSKLWEDAGAQRAEGMDKELLCSVDGAARRRLAPSRGQWLPLFSIVVKRNITVAQSIMTASAGE
jgi:hypothetical protein